MVNDTKNFVKFILRTLYYTLNTEMPLYPWLTELFDNDSLKKFLRVVFFLIEKCKMFCFSNSSWEYVLAGGFYVEANNRSSI